MDQGEIDRITQEAVEKTNFKNRMEKVESRLNRIEWGFGGFIIWLLTQFGDKISQLLNLRIGGE